MTELDTRLFRCISSIRPNLSDTDIQQLDIAYLLDSDSLATVTLLALLDEEFGIMLDPETLLNLGSFQALRQYLFERTSTARGDEQGTP